MSALKVTANTPKTVVHDDQRAHIFAQFDQGDTPTVCVVNKATVPLGVDFEKLVAALQTFATNYFEPLWNTPCVLKIADDVEAGCWGLVLSTDADVANALGYHDYTRDGLPMSHVFVRTTLSNRGHVSTTAAHELAEMLVNPGLQMTVEGPDGSVFYAYETADAVEGEEWFMPEFPDVPMTDFVTPAYFEGFRAPHSRRFDFLGRISRPFEILRGGYMPIHRNGQWTQIFGSLEVRDKFELHHHSRLARLSKTRHAWRFSRDPSTGVTEKPAVQAGNVDEESRHDAAKEPLQERVEACGLSWSELKPYVVAWGTGVVEAAEDFIRGGLPVQSVYSMLASGGSTLVNLLTKKRAKDRRSRK